MEQVHRDVSVSSRWLPDEAKIETKQEEDEMHDGATTADLRCFDKTCAQQRHRNIGEIKVEHRTRRHEERACQKFTKVPISPGEIEAPDGHDDSRSYVKGNYHAFLLPPPSQLVCVHESLLSTDHPADVERARSLHAAVGGVTRDAPCSAKSFKTES
jgi:hypothetical protein